LIGGRPVKAKICWTSVARTDLREVRARLREQSPNATIRFAQSIRDAVRLLEDFPFLGAVALDLEPVGRYRHVIKGWHRIIYRVDAGTVYILRVWDHRRNPDDLAPVE
jgi:plasmid stabilization system protein ParE